MKRALVAFALLLVAASAAAHDGWHVAIRNDGHTFVNGDFSGDEFDELKNRYGRSFAVFEKGNVGYVVTDRAALDKLQSIIEPQSELGHKQGELGRQQGELGREQGRLGREQGRLGREQARLARGYADDDAIEALAAKQRDLAAQQRELAARQRELGERQRELAARQRQLAKEIERELDRFVESAIRNGIAKKR